MNPWAKASKLARLTPPERNRYVDFLRALSILAVVSGHWLMAAPHFDSGQPKLAHLLEISPPSRILTWLFQVMPVFFFVGGFSNKTSWESARCKGQSFAAWFGARMKRLTSPVLLLLATWGVLAAIGYGLGVPAGMIRVGSQISLIPVWFLAVYLLVVACVPLSHSAWKRFGWTSIWPLIAAAALVDLAFFRAGLEWLGWANYLFIWLAVHQLGYAWHDGKVGGSWGSLSSLLVGALALVMLTWWGPYPLSLVGVPGEAVSNTRPPKLPLAALAAAQIGLLLALESPMRRWLEGERVWTATVLLNGLIMTVFLWHSTVMMLLIGAVLWLQPALLDPLPASLLWWSWRPVWLLAYTLLLIPTVFLVIRIEVLAPKSTTRTIRPSRLLLGTAMICLGLAFLASGGVGSDRAPGVRLLPLLFPFLGAGIAGFGLLAWPRTLFRR